MFKIDPKTVITVASVLVSAGMIGILAADPHTVAPPAADVKGTSTAVATPAPKVVTPATIVSVGNTNTPSTNSQDPSDDTENISITPSVDLVSYNDSNGGNNDTPEAAPPEPLAPAGPTEPIPAPDPVPEVPAIPIPQPAFSIALREDQASAIDVLGVKQLIVPFDVLLEAGFVATTYGQPQCTFLNAPADHNLLCNVSQKDAGSGTLSLQYTTLSPAGRYEVQVSYVINEVMRTDVFAFDIAPVVSALF